MCEDEKCRCHHRGRYHGRHYHHRHDHGHWKYSIIGKRTSETANIPEILFEVADIEEGDFYKIYIKKIKKEKS